MATLNQIRAPKLEQGRELFINITAGFFRILTSRYVKLILKRRILPLLKLRLYSYQNVYFKNSNCN